MKKLAVFTCLLLLFSFPLSGCVDLPAAGVNNAGEGTQNHEISLSVLAGQSTSDAGTEDMINDALEARYPDITLEWECVDWGEKFAPEMTVKFAAGDVPDIMVGKAQDVATYVPSGNLAPLSGPCLSNVLAASLPAVIVNNKVYGLSYNALYQGVMYNKDIFRKMGIDVPVTQTELKAAVDRLKTAGITPYASHLQEIWSIGNMTMQFAMNDVFNKYHDWGDLFRAGKTSFSSSEEYRGCFMYDKDILDNTWDDAMAIGQAEADTRFAKGEAAMYVTGSWTLQIINEINPGMNVGIFPFPNRSGDSRLIFEPNMTFMKSSKTENGKAVDRVFDLIFSDKELAVGIFNFTKTASMLKGVTTTFPNPIQDDIDRYVKSGQVTDATIGNTQLIWTFQEDYSRQLYSWLQGKASLEDILAYIDHNRDNSISRSN